MTHAHIRAQYTEVLAAGYTVMPCREYAEGRSVLPERTLVNRVDIDFSLTKVRPLLEIFASLGIRASFFLRLHAPEYNPFSFENYLIVREIVAAGHELGLHAELEDQRGIWGEDAGDCLRRDLKVMREMFGTEVVGVASHRGFTPWNNLDFWQTHRAQEFGLLYEAYDTAPEFNLFGRAFYVSDSEWVDWKCYDRGVLVDGDRRTLGEHARDGHALLYALIHADTYYARHTYERNT